MSETGEEERQAMLRKGACTTLWLQGHGRWPRCLPIA
jgi:hypothetical protein